MKAKFENREGKLFIDGKEVLKEWESFSGWYWFGIEILEKDWNGAPLWFGYVQGFEDEYGEFSEAELNELKGKVWEIPSENLHFSGRR